MTLICTVCGKEFRNKPFPIEHGEMGITIFPNSPAKYEPCPGKLIEKGMVV